MFFFTPCGKQLALGLALAGGLAFTPVVKGWCTEQLEWFTCHRFLEISLAYIKN